MFNCCVEEPPLGDSSEVQVVAGPIGADPDESAKDPEDPTLAEPWVSADNSALPEPDAKAEADAEPKDAEPKAAAVNSKSFQVTISKESGDIGLAYYFVESYLIVAGGIGGPLEAWNKAQTDTFSKIRIFDRIVQINGVAGTKKELEAKMMEEGEMIIDLEHPRQLEVGLEKKGQPVGLSMTSSNGVTGAVITDVQEGLIKQFNLAAPADKQIKVNDIAVKIDNEQMRGADLINKIEDLEKFKVRILSYTA